MLWTSQQVTQSPQVPLSFLLMEHFLSHNVAIERTNHGRLAIKVNLLKNDSHGHYTEDEAVDGLRYGHVEVPLTKFYQGTLDVDIAIERNQLKNGSDSSSIVSAGLVFRKHSNHQYDLVYLSMAKGASFYTVDYVSPPNWASSETSTAVRI